MGADWFRMLRERREAERKLRDDALGKVGQIESHPETKVICRADAPHAWGYVEDEFPSVAEAIKRTRAFKNENTAFCAKLGVPKGAGGLFFIKASAILICYNPEIPDDVVVVHELLHYVSLLLGGSMSNPLAEEAFAYVQSLPFLLKHHDEAWVVEKYLWPYYSGLQKYEWLQANPSRRGKIPQDCIENIKSATGLRCANMIKKAKNGEDVVPEKTRPRYGRFDLL